MSATIAVGRKPVSDAWTLTLRVLLFYRNSPALVGTSLGAPLILLVMFGYVFGSAIEIPGGEEYRSYLTPGLFVLIAVNGIMASMVGAARDLERWVGFFLGMACRREEIAAQAGLLVLPISTISNVYVPTAGMPGWLRTIADWNPVSCATSAARSLFGDTLGATATSPWPLVHPVEATLGWSAALIALFMPLAVRAFSTHGR